MFWFDKWVNLLLIEKKYILQTQSWMLQRHRMVNTLTQILHSSYAYYILIICIYIRILHIHITNTILFHNAMLQRHRMVANTNTSLIVQRSAWLAWQMMVNDSIRSVIGLIREQWWPLCLTAGRPCHNFLTQGRDGSVQWTKKIV